jgi:hypothetical protein
MDRAVDRNNVVDRNNTHVNKPMAYIDRMNVKGQQRWPFAFETRLLTREPLTG